MAGTLSTADAMKAATFNVGRVVRGFEEKAPVSEETWNAVRERLFTGEDSVVGQLSQGGSFDDVAARMVQLDHALQAGGYTIEKDIARTMIQTQRQYLEESFPGFKDAMDTALINSREIG